MKQSLIITLLALFVIGCSNKKDDGLVITTNVETPFVWEGVNMYFLLTDRFNNVDTSNDVNFDRTKETGVLRGFEGGDLKGITQKIEEGYFSDLGINAIWFSPIVEQIHGATDEGTGVSYGYHAYWTKDWTALDPNFGTEDDLRTLVETAHKNGIRIVLDGVINHTGPVTEKDPVWGNDWVRTEPQCEYNNYDNTVNCTLVKNLPDILTNSVENVDIPIALAEKWKAEDRYEQEMKELDEFFARTGYPRAPKFYIIKWLTDYIREFGVDGYRADTVKHTDELVWENFKTECDSAFATWKKNNTDKVLDDNDFYIVGEVYNYGISGGKYFDFGDKKVNYFDNMFTSQINFEFKWNAAQSTYEELFSKYNSILQNELKEFGVLNYLTSHDDGQPFDKERTKTYEAGIKLLLAPGGAQIYYGDESARNLNIEGTIGDATLRSNMNWDDIENKKATKALLEHYQKLGTFRNNHPAVGAGIHKMISEQPYIFQRIYASENYTDAVVVGLDLNEGVKELNVSSVFKNDDLLVDAYSGAEVIVKNGFVKLDTAFNIVLLELKK